MVCMCVGVWCVCVLGVFVCVCSVVWCMFVCVVWYGECVWCVYMWCGVYMCVCGVVYICIDVCGMVW